MKKKCLECKDPIIGRADKKFCSDQCRNTYNNKLNSDSNNFVRNFFFSLLSLIDNFFCHENRCLA